LQLNNKFGTFANQSMMPESKRLSTNSFSKSVFKPHGSMQLQQSGQLNILEATGPFNTELVIAADAAQEELYASLAKKGRWGTVLIFRENALASLDAVAQITTILLRRSEQGYVPVAVALVADQTVEGGAFMQPLYLNAYKKAGIQSRTFFDEAAACDWVASVIDGQ
jgi:hypothetical protein